MDSFRPSRDFVARTMETVHSYEAAITGKEEREDAGLLSRPALYALSVGGGLLGMLNLVRTIWALIAPPACL